LRQCLAIWLSGHGYFLVRAAEDRPAAAPSRDFSNALTTRQRRSKGYEARVTDLTPSISYDGSSGEAQRTRSARDCRFARGAALKASGASWLGRTARSAVTM